MEKGKPIISAACLCENALEDKDGVISLIRVIDQFNVGAPPDVVERLNPHLVMTLVVILKANGLVGEHKLTFQLHGPTKSQEPDSRNFSFPEGPLSTINMRVTIAIGVVKNFGDFRIELSLDDEYLTTVPFRVVQMPV